MANKATSTPDPETPAAEETNTETPAETETASAPTGTTTDSNDAGPRDDEGRFTSLDTFENPHEQALAAVQTATDGNGVERIIGPVDTTWTPAPLEASDEEKAAADRRNRMFDQASKKRLEQLKGNIQPEDTGVNDPSQGGSQTSTETVAEAAEKESK